MKKMYGNRHGLKRILLSGCLVVVFALSAQLFAEKGGNGGGGKPGGGENVNYAFVHNVIDKGSLFLTTIDGASTFQLTSPGGNFDADRNPSWSHDLDPLTEGNQSKIAYLQFLDNDDLNYLYVINPDGSGNQLVRAFAPNEPKPEHGNGEAVLVWSPNGKEILFSDQDLLDVRQDQDSGIYAVEVATGNVRTLIGKRLVNDYWYGPLNPSISPLGLLAFEFLKDIYTVEFVLDENGLMQVDPQAEWTPFTFGDPQIEWNEYPVWSPDGTNLAFINRDRSVDPEVDRLVVYDVLLDEYIEVSEIQSGYRQVTWSPDGSEIAIAEVTYTRNNAALDIYRITDWDDPELRQFIRVTLTDRNHEIQPHWNPGWVSP